MYVEVCPVRQQGAPVAACSCSSALGVNISQISLEYFVFGGCVTLTANILKYRQNSVGKMTAFIKKK